jgi:hypothetical protein
MLQFTPGKKVTVTFAAVTFAAVTLAAVTLAARGPKSGGSSSLPVLPISWV